MSDLFKERSDIIGEFATFLFGEGMGSALHLSFGGVHDVVFQDLDLYISPERMLRLKQNLPKDNEKFKFIQNVDYPAQGTFKPTYGMDYTHIASGTRLSVIASERMKIWRKDVNNHRDPNHHFTYSNYAQLLVDHIDLNRPKDIDRLRESILSEGMRVFDYSNPHRPQIMYFYNFHMRAKDDEIFDERNYMSLDLECDNIIYIPIADPTVEKVYLNDRDFFVLGSSDSICLLRAPGLRFQVVKADIDSFINFDRSCTAKEYQVVQNPETKMLDLFSSHIDVDKIDGFNFNLVDNFSNNLLGRLFIRFFNLFVRDDLGAFKDKHFTIENIGVYDDLLENWYFKDATEATYFTVLFNQEDLDAGFINPVKVILDNGCVEPYKVYNQPTLRLCILDGFVYIFTLFENAISLEQLNKFTSLIGFRFDGEGKIRYNPKLENMKTRFAKEWVDWGWPVIEPGISPAK